MCLLVGDERKRKRADNDAAVECHFLCSALYPIIIADWRDICFLQKGYPAHLASAYAKHTASKSFPFLLHLLKLAQRGGMEGNWCSRPLQRSFLFLVWKSTWGQTVLGRVCVLLRLQTCIPPKAIPTPLFSKHCFHGSMWVEAFLGEIFVFDLGQICPRSCLYFRYKTASMVQSHSCVIQMSLIHLEVLCLNRLVCSFVCLFTGV